jgi:hypothetical protein
MWAVQKKPDMPVFAAFPFLRTSPHNKTSIDFSFQTMAVATVTAVGCKLQAHWLADGGVHTAKYYCIVL